MKNALLKVREYKEIMTPTEKEIADYILLSFEYIT